MALHYLARASEARIATATEPAFRGSAQMDRSALPAGRAKCAHSGHDALVSRLRERLAITQLALFGAINLGFAIWAFANRLWCWGVVLLVLAPICVPLIVQIKRQAPSAKRHAVALNCLSRTDRPRTAVMRYP